MFVKDFKLDLSGLVKLAACYSSNDSYVDLLIPVLVHQLNRYSYKYAGTSPTRGMASDI